MPGTRNSYLAFFISTICSLCSIYGVRPGLLFMMSVLVTVLFNILRHQLVLIEQVDRLLDEGGLVVFQMLTELLQPLGVAIADPALQPAVGFLLAFHVLALPLGIVLRHIHLHFLAHMTLLTKSSWFVISHSIRQEETLPCQG